MADRTEEPTPRRLREARRRGEVARSADLTAGAALLGCGLALVASGPAVLATLLAGGRAAFGPVAMPPGPAAGALPGFLGEQLRAGLLAIAPVLLAAFLVAAAAAGLQAGGLLAPGAIAPKLARVDPVQGARRLLSRARLVDVGKAWLKLGLLAVAVALVIADAARGVLALAGATPRDVAAAAGTLTGAALLRGAWVLLGFGVIDLVHQRWRFRRERRMTKDEVRRETKDQEGDPVRKQARQRAHREIVEHAVLEDVRRADVVVVNPTHLAVALRYDPEDGADAPTLVAKGQGALAARMIDAARDAGVPVLRDVPLARSLVALDLGETVPERLFEAVAAVLHAADRERTTGAPGRDDR